MTYAHTGLLAVLLTLAALAVIEPLSAQQLPQPAPGQRVRVTPAELGATPYVGELLVLSESALVVRQDSMHTRRFEPSQVQRIEVSQGLRSLTREGAGLGGIVGLVAGIAYGMHRSVCPEGATIGDCDIHRFAHSVGPATVGVLAGTLLGGAVGMMVKVEAWQTVSFDRLRAGVVPLPGGRVGLGASLVF